MDNVFLREHQAIWDATHQLQRQVTLETVVQTLATLRREPHIRTRIDELIQQLTTRLDARTQYVFSVQEALTLLCSNEGRYANRETLRNEVGRLRTLKAEIQEDPNSQNNANALVGDELRDIDDVNLPQVPADDETSSDSSADDESDISDDASDNSDE
jgi:hypothetical protein